MYLKIKNWTKTINGILNDIKNNSHCSSKINDDHVWNIYCLSNFGEDLFISKDNYYKLREIIYSYLNSLPSLKYNPSELLTLLIQDIINHYRLHPMAQYSQDLLINFFANINDNSEQVENIYYIECQLPNDIRVDEFYIGPVKFIKSKNLIDIIKDNIIQHKNLNDIKEFFSRYEWVAKIKLSHKKSYEAKKYARNCLDVIIAFFTLFFGTQFHNYIYRSNLNPEKKLELVEYQSGKISARKTKLFLNNREKNSNWLAVLDKNKEVINYLGRYIEHLLSFKNLSLLSKKFYYALMMYKEAIIEPNKVSGLVKLAIALEYLIYIEGNKDISKKFYTRVKFLYDGNSDKTDNILKKIKRLYELRSQIVHGACLNNYNIDLDDFYPTALEITKTCLVHFMISLAQTGFDYNISNKDMEKFYRQN